MDTCAPVTEPATEPVTETLTPIAEMCTEFGVTPRTLRFYESKELIAPLRVGQKRLYTRRCRARLKLILRGRRFGFALEEMRELLDLYDNDGEATQLARTVEVASRRLAEMEAQRAELDTAIAELREQLAWARSVLDGRGGQAAE